MLKKLRFNVYEEIQMDDADEEFYSDDNKDDNF